MTGMVRLLDNQALWDYGPDGKVVRPRDSATTEQRATFILAAQHARFGVMRYDPSQPRDPDGKWGDGTSGPSAPDPSGDKLGLRGRISLGPGERLLSSAKVKQSDDSEVSAFIAAIETPTGPQVRLGIDPGLDEGLEFDDEGEEVEGPPRGWAGDDPATTVRLDQGGVDQLRAELERHTATAKARQAELVAGWDRIRDLEQRFRAAHSTARDNRDPETLEYTAADRARIDDISAELQPLYDVETAADDIDDIIAEGVVAGLPGGGDLAYQMWGVDDERGGWRFELAVKPSDAGPDWDFYEATDGGQNAGNLAPRDVAALLRQVAGMVP